MSDSADDSGGRPGWLSLPRILIGVAISVVTLLGLLAGLKYQIDPRSKPDPNERLSAALSVMAVERKVSIADYLHRVSDPGDFVQQVDRFVRQQVNDQRPTRLELQCERQRQVHLHGFVVYAKITVDGLKRRSVALGSALYEERSRRRIPQSEAIFPPHRLVSPTDTFVDAVFVNHPSAERPGARYFVRLELRDQGDHTLLAIANSRPFHDFTPPVMRSRPCPR
jgi:hypothetical protein